MSFIDKILCLKKKKLLLTIFLDSNKISNLRKRRLEMLYSKKINMADIRARI